MAVLVVVAVAVVVVLWWWWWELLHVLLFGTLRQRVHKKACMGWNVTYLCITQK